MKVSFKFKNINKLIIVLFFFNSINLLAQEIVLKGVVINSENKEPILGVNIFLKNSSIGTISNLDGKFILHVPEEYKQEIIMFSSIGYALTEHKIDDFRNDDLEVVLNPTTTVLDEVVVSASNIDLTANQIVESALNYYDENFPTKPYIAKGFLRHTEKNKKEYKWLIESAITLYDNSKRHDNAIIKINVDEIRKSYDFRSLDTLSLYLYYLNLEKGSGTSVFKKRKYKKIADTITSQELLKGIRYNDAKSNGLHKLFNGHKNIVIDKNNFNNGNQNILRNYGNVGAMFDENIFKKHKFSLDTLLLEGDRYVYKIKITPHSKMVDLNSILKKNYVPVGWLFIYKDNYAIKELEYSLIAASKSAKLRNKLIYGTPIHYTVNLKYIEYNNRMYLKYFSCEVPKSINTYFKQTESGDYEVRSEEDRFYYTKQEVLFTEFITDKEEIELRLQKPWNDDLFTPRPYHEQFWKNYNILLESKEQHKMIQDLEDKVRLSDQFKL